MSMMAQVPGQDVENALLLTEGVTKEFTSFENGRNELYAKFVAEDDGVVTINLATPTTYARWMEEGVMAYGKLRYDMFRGGNQFNVEKNHTYYLYYNFAAPVSSSISYSIEVAQEGSTRNKAIVITSDCTKQLLGKAKEGDDFFNVYTWFKIERGSQADKNLLSVAMSGDNMTILTLYKNDETDALASYSMGDVSGMLAPNSTVLFDIDLTTNDYYISIMQDDINGVATFAFQKTSEGQTIGSAIEAYLGVNSSVAGNWYKYTHNGDDIITISNVALVVDANKKNVAIGDDVKDGFRMREGQTVYFQANSSEFMIATSEIPVASESTNPLVITLDKDSFAQFSFTLNGSASDTRRYMKYTATADGLFMYGTDNKKVIDTAFGSTVRDITNEGSSSPVSVIQKYESSYGMFIYQWQVKEGHTYLIEQTLVNNLGLVTFMATFTEAAEGESLNKAIALTLNQPFNLGRKEAPAKYFKFTANEDGEYLLSANVAGLVHVYGEDEHNISKDYENGTDFHNEVIALTAGQTLLFSVAPSSNIEHLSVGIQDFFIPNYYVVISRANNTNDGLCIAEPKNINEGEIQEIDTNNTWFGPIEVPAGSTMSVVVNSADASDDLASVFVTNEKGQFITNEKEISFSKKNNSHIYTLLPSAANRKVYIMACGLTSSGAFAYTFSSPDVTSIEGTESSVCAEGTKKLMMKNRVVIVKGDKVYDVNGR